MKTPIVGQGAFIRDGGRASLTRIVRGERIRLFDEQGREQKGTDSTEDLREYTASEIESARKSEAKFTAWAAQRTIEPLGLNGSHLSELARQRDVPPWRDGGLYVKVNDRRSYVDFKTGGLTEQTASHRTAGLRARTVA